MLNRLYRHLLKKRAEKQARNMAIDPDVVFLDSTNLPKLDTDQFEGKIERPITRKSIFFILGFAIVIFLVFFIKLYNLQVLKGSVYKDLSENNRLKHSVVFSARGVITDRNKVALSWNIASSSDEFPLRRYSNLSGISHLTGYVTYPAKDSSGNYYNYEYVAKTGIEKMFDSDLRGTHGTKLVETDVRGNVVAESQISPDKPGESIILSVDNRLQTYLYDAIKETAEKSGFTGGAGVLMDIKNGEILAHVTYPEYSAETMTNGSSSAIKEALTAPNNPYLDRVSTGLYTPGSIIKPYMALAALNEKIITPEKEILSTGSITVPNPYDPSKPSIYKDWKAHGYVDMRRALQVSSDVYFYEVGGGYGDQKGLGISNIDKYMNIFGFGEDMYYPFFKAVPGLVPTPDWKKNKGDGPWRLGDTYITAIGQYGFQVTPIQVVRALSAIANEGTRVEPTIIKDDESNRKYWKKIDLPHEYFQVVKEGMRMSATDGTSRALSSVPIKIGGKSGTAELGVKKDFVNSWVEGFYPYDNPHYVFAILMEHGPVHNLIGAPYVGSVFLNKLAENTPEYKE